MEENTRFLMQLANFLAQQNPSQTAAAANVSNGSTGGAPAINSYSTNNAVAEITKILINTASNLIPQMQASAAPSQQPSQQQQQQPQSIPPPSQQPHQQTTSSSQSLPPPPPSSQQQQHQQLQNSQQSEPSLSHQTQLDNSEQKPLQQLQQQQQQQQSHIASQQQISQSSSQIQSKQHQQHQPEHQQTQVHHQHQQQQIRHQQEQQPQQQTQIHHHQQQQNQHHHQQQQNQHHHQQQQNQHHHQQQNQHHQQQQQNQHHQQQQQNQHHQQQQQSQHHHQQQQQRNQHHHQHHQQHHQQNQQQQNNHHHQQQQQQQQPLENPQQQLERLQQQLQQLQQLHSSNQQLEQTIQISQQHKDNSSLSITPISHSNSEALNTNVSLPQGPATTCMSSPTYSMSNLNDMQFDGPAAKHAMGEKGGAFSLPYMLQKRLRLPREKMKRGPKEKEFFRCFLFCLPDMYAKMPKFTSSDPLEQEIVRSYQSQGYGFPGQDFIGGVPKKTYLCLKQKEERFLQYLISIYPVLENKRFELYRVDRQRNLIQLSDRTPRAIKDTKYQGTIIIIPFTRSSYLEAEQPVNVNSEIRFGQGNSNSPPLEIVQTVGNASFTSTDDEQSFGEMSASRMSLEEGILTNDSSPYQRSLEESFQKNNLDFNRLDLFTRLINARNQLTNVRDIKMPPKLFLVDQLFPLYQNDEDICNCCLNLTSVEETEPGDNTASLQAKKMFCNFWKKVLHKHFSGSFEKYPVVCPENGGDFFNVLGKILSHGFLLYGYWPVRFAKASACFVITEIQNEDSLLKSFKNTLSDFELCVVNAALKEARMLPPKFSVDLEGRLVTVLEKYGILNVPAPCDLGDTLQRIAQTILIQRPYWALKQLADGCKKSISCSFIGEMSEHDVEYLYLSLVPEPSVLIRKIEYKHCDVTEEAFYVLEKKVRQQFEMYLWSVNREQLEVIVECWGGCDCLIAPKYYVQFSLPESGCGAVFNCQQSLLTLSKRLVNKTDIADALKNAIELENTDWN